MDNIIHQFVTLFAVIDPIGTVPVFLAVGAKFRRKDQIQVALRATITSFFVLLFFALAGQALLEHLEIKLMAFQIAGGIVLFIFALTMIFGEAKPQSELEMLDNRNEVAVFPLAIPSIASPGAIMAIVLLTDNNRFDMLEQLETIGVMVGVLLIAFGMMLLAGKIQKLIGDSGAILASRVMGLLISALATTYVLEGIKIYFSK